MKKIYISGPITGIKNYKRNFRKAERLIRDAGYKAVNPCTIDHYHDKSYKSYMRADVKALLNCDGIVMLDGWKQSKGASFELAVAEVCGIGRILL